jgi:hypothetical protein
MHHDKRGCPSVLGQPFSRSAVQPFSQPGSAFFTDQSAWLMLDHRIQGDHPDRPHFDRVVQKSVQRKITVMDESLAHRCAQIVITRNHISRDAKRIEFSVKPVVNLGFAGVGQVASQL